MARARSSLPLALLLVQLQLALVQCTENALRETVVPTTNFPVTPPHSNVSSPAATTPTSAETCSNLFMWST